MVKRIGIIAALGVIAAFGVPRAGKVAILNGCVGTPPIKVRTTVLKFGTRNRSSPSKAGWK